MPTTMRRRRDSRSLPPWWCRSSALVLNNAGDAVENFGA
jgi:hypothetical protein